jgi:hypothetical protein
VTAARFIANGPVSVYRVDAQRLEVVGDGVLGEAGDSRVALPV